jgi:hypothetical protein
MKKLFLSSIIAFLAISLGLYAQDTAQAEPKVKLQLVYKKDFNEMTVGPEGFPPPEIKQLLKDKDIPQEDKEWLLNSLRIEIARRKKVLYTNDGKAIKLPDDLQSISTSQNLKYMIIYAAHTDYGGLTADEVKKLRDDWLDAYKRYSQWQTKYEKAAENFRQAFIDSMHYWLKISDSLNEFIRLTERNKKEYKKFLCIETASGRVLWEKENMEPPRYISNDAKTIIGVPGYHFFSSAIFYDEYGNEKKRVGGLWGPQGCHDMSADGEMFCVITRINQKDTSVMAVAAYDSAGNQAWLTELAGTWPRGDPCIAVSPTHKYVAVTLWGKNWWREAYTFLLNEKGIVKNTYNYKTYYPGFSFDDKYLILGTIRDTIYFISTDDGAVLWSKVLGGHSYKKPIVSKDGRAIFFISQVPERHPAYLLDKDGDIIWIGSHELKNAIGLSPAGYFFIPSANPDVIIYRITSEVSDEGR